MHLQTVLVALAQRVAWTYATGGTTALALLLTGLGLAAGGKISGKFSKMLLAARRS